jgi:Holliday junction resolvase RusA-like endonuclease
MNKDAEQQIQRNEAERKLRDQQRAVLLHQHGSKEFHRLNPVLSDFLKKMPPASAAVRPVVQNHGNAAKLRIVLVGQVRGGKNAMGVTKTGKHYARPAFKKWRDEMSAQISMPLSFIMVREPVNIRVDYVAGDRKRRDMTGILDALFHLLEYCYIVSDDSLLWVVESSRSYSKESPGVTITFL